jgi:WD40 repeat protein
MGGPPYDGAFRLVLGRSRDGGATWGESEIIDPVDPIQRFIVFLPAFPSVAVDRSGRVYAAFHDDRLGDSDVWLWTLDPGESDWGEPTRVNDTARRDGTWQYLPKVSVSPDGRLDVVYYDRRSDPRNVMEDVSLRSFSDAGEPFAPALRLSGHPFDVPSVSFSPDGRLDFAYPDRRSEPGNVMNHVSLQSSFDAGRSFTPALRLSSRSFDSRIGFGAKEGLPDLGSRLGLISTDQAALALWTDTRAGTPETQKQDLAKAVAAIEEPEGLAEPAEALLRYGGLALAFTGLGLLVVWWRPIRRSRVGHRTGLEPGAGSV